MAGNEHMSSEEYYKHYLEQTAGKEKQNSNPKKPKKEGSSSFKKIIIFLLFIVLLGGLYYLWKQKNSTENDTIVNNDLAKQTAHNALVQTKQKEDQKLVAQRTAIAKAENIRLAKIKSDEKIKFEKEKLVKKAENIANAKAEKLRLTKIALDKKLKLEKALQVKEATRIAKEKAEKLRIAKIKADKKLKLEKALQVKEAARIAKEKTERLRLAKIKADKKLKLEKEKIALDKKNKVIFKDIYKLEQDLLSGLKESQTPTSAKRTKKVDTFNKIVLDKKIAKTKTKTKTKNLSKASTQLTNIMNTSNKTKNAYTKALKVEAKTREDEMQFVTVKEGDTLFYIAKRIYGDAMLYPIIFEANPDILNDPARISIGQKLRVPKIKEPTT